MCSKVVEQKKEYIAETSALESKEQAIKKYTYNLNLVERECNEIEALVRLTRPQQEIEAQEIDV